MNAPLVVSICVDPREACLGRAAARDALYQAGAIDLDEAFNALVEPFMAIVAPPVCEVCDLAPCPTPSWCETCRRADRLRRRHR
jgi:hypothetical protein